MNFMAYSYCYLVLVLKNSPLDYANQYLLIDLGRTMTINYKSNYTYLLYVVYRETFLFCKNDALSSAEILEKVEFLTAMK